MQTSIAMLAIAVAAAALAGAAPIQVSIWTVFLFAGPHNWMEARYFMARMPVRWGRSRVFFTIAIAGVLLLSAAWALGPNDATSRALWHSALILWILALIHFSRRPMPAAWPVGLLLMSAAWLAPYAADFAIVYIHPLLALWFLDIQIRRRRPEWRRPYRTCLACLPLILILFCLTATPATAQDGIAVTIIEQAGSRLLVSTHVFLETLHYAVWLAALPLLGLGDIPLIRHRDGKPRLMRGIMLAGAAAVALLWVCFALDYATVRQVYFTVAIVHVLAEAPFLLRLL